MGFTQARINASVDAAVVTTTHAQLHTGAPGGSGTSNVAAGVPRVACVFPAASAGETEKVVSFVIPGAGGPYTHVSIWTASADGTFNGDGECTTQESFAGAGTLEVTIVASGDNAA